MKTIKLFIYLILIFFFVISSTSANLYIKITVFELNSLGIQVPVQGASISIDKFNKGSTDAKGCLTASVSPNADHVFLAKKIRGSSTLCGSKSIHVPNPRSGYAPAINIIVRPGVC